MDGAGRLQGEIVTDGSFLFSFTHPITSGVEARYLLRITRAMRLVMVGREPYTCAQKKQLTLLSHLTEKKSPAGRCS